MTEWTEPFTASELIQEPDDVTLTGAAVTRFFEMFPDARTAFALGDLTPKALIAWNVEHDGMCYALGRAWDVRL
jgi:hypothetical protein